MSIDNAIRKSDGINFWRMILYYAKKMCAFHKECKDHYNKYLCWLLFLDLEYLSLSPISCSHSTSWFIFIKTNSQITAKTIVLYEYKCNNNVAPDFILFLCGVFTLFTSYAVTMAFYVQFHIFVIENIKFVFLFPKQRI